MDSGSLLQHACSIITSYRPSQCTLHTHLQGALQGLEPGGRDALFLSQVAQGVCRNEAALRVLLNALFHVCSARLLRADFTVYQVLAYLILFRLDELGVPQLLPLLDCQPPASTHAMLSFLLDERSMAEWVVEGWCKTLDREYVHSELLGRLRRHAPALREWLASTAVKAFGPGGGTSASASSTSSSSSSSLKQQRPAPTIPCAPKLTAPRARLPPEPTAIPMGFTARPAPLALLARTSLEALEEERAAAAAAAKAATLAAYGPAGPAAPRLAATRSTVDRVRAEVEAARAAEAGVAFRAQPAPATLPSASASVRLTAAALLREDAVFKRRQAQEAALLQEFEATLRDSSGYDAWRAEALARDAAAEEAAAAALRVQAAAAAAAAAAAKAAVGRHKAAIGQGMRAAGSVVEEYARVESAGERALRLQLAGAVRATEYSAPAAEKARVAQGRREEAEGVRAASAAAAAALAAASARDAAERTELIRQLRALERTPQPHNPALAFNPGQVGAPGKDADAGVWMEAMSLVELRERLQAGRAAARQAQAARHGAILVGKREAASKLAAVAEACAERRAARGAAGQQRRAQRSASAAAAAGAAAEAEEAVIVAASEALEARAVAGEAARREEARAARRAAGLAHLLADASAAAEARRLADRGRGAARVSQAEQAAAIAAAEVEAGVRAGEAGEAASRAAAARVAREAAAAEEALALARSRQEQEAARGADSAWRKAMFFAGVHREGVLAESLAQLQPYKAAAEREGRERGKGGSTVDALRASTLEKRMERLPAGHPLQAKLGESLRGLAATLGGSSSSGSSSSSSSSSGNVGGTVGWGQMSTGRA